MTRFEFYIKTVILLSIGMVFVLCSDDKARMEYNLMWVVNTLGAYLVWRDWTFFPITLNRFVADKLFGTEANPKDQRPPSGGPVHLVVGGLEFNEGIK